MHLIRTRSAVAALLYTLLLPASATPHADSHAPIGVMADHFHQAGEWMLSYRFMSMRMDGNLVDGDEVSAQTIATTQANRFFGTPGQPPTLRVVPLHMDMQMHMFGLMYAPSDRLTLMVMGQYLRKDMRHLTFQGGMGTNVLGEFDTQVEGWGDTRVSALVPLLRGEQQRLHLVLGVSLPTGSNDETDTVLAPTGATPTLRLPYPMQLGSGSTDILAGLSWAGHFHGLGLGAQYDAVIRPADNDEDYRLGDEHQLSVWLSRAWTDVASSALRVVGHSKGRIDGQDPAIVAPVQTADPDRQGGERIDLGLSINLFAPGGPVAGHRVAFEYLFPLWQDLNGPQLETDGVMAIGWQFAF